MDMRILMITATVCLTGCLIAPPPDELDAINWGAITSDGGRVLLLEGQEGGGVLADAHVISLGANDRGEVAGVSARGDTIHFSAPGWVRIWDIASGDVLQERELGAVGVAWSNGGELLAVIARDLSEPASSAHSLMVLTAELDTVTEIPIELPVPDESSDYRTFIVSWSPDDSRVAISTDAILPCGGVKNDVVIPLCRIVQLSDGSKDTFELCNVYFIGLGQIVGTVPGSNPADTRSSAYRVHVMRLGEGRILDRSFVLGAKFAVASHPPTGIFAVSELFVFPVSCFSEIHLRSTRARAAQTIANQLDGEPFALFRRGDIEGR